MITLDRVRELVADPNLSDTEAERIRDACHSMAELLLDAWEYERARANKGWKEKERPKAAS